MEKLEEYIKKSESTLELSKPKSNILKQLASAVKKPKSEKDLLTNRTEPTIEGVRKAIKALSNGFQIDDKSSVSQNVDQEQMFRKRGNPEKNKNKDEQIDTESNKKQKIDGEKRDWMEGKDLKEALGTYNAGNSVNINCKVHHGIGKEDELKILIQEAKENLSQKKEQIMHQEPDVEKVIIPLNIHSINKTIENGTTHWAGIIISKEGKNYKVQYIDPMGHAPSKQVADIIRDKLGVEEIEQPYNLSGVNEINSPKDIEKNAKVKGMQYVEFLKEDEGLARDGNGWPVAWDQSNDKDCGRFLVYLVTECAQNNGVTQITTDHSKEQSNQIADIIDIGLNEGKDFNIIKQDVRGIISQQNIEQEQKQNQDKQENQNTGKQSTADKQQDESNKGKNNELMLRRNDNVDIHNIKISDKNTRNNNKLLSEDKRSLQKSSSQKEMDTKYEKLLQGVNFGVLKRSDVLKYENKLRSKSVSKFS